jgi:hypothetical protein
MEDIHLGNSLRNTKNPTDATIRGYMNSAAEAWRILTGTAPPLFDDARDGERAKLKPIVADILGQQRAWKEPKSKREPYTFPMFSVLHSEVQRSTARLGAAFLGQQFAIFDWTRLGIFTGSRLSEYGQSKPRKGERFAVVPSSTHAGEWAGTPVAFIRDDFTFYDKSMLRLTCSTAIAQQRSIEYVHIRFRYDKSPTNFSLRKFQRSRGTFLCPVKAVVSILLRADLLGIPSSYPIGAFRSECNEAEAGSGTFQLIKGEHVQAVMRDACVKAYPDASHYMRQHIDRIHSHSNRVTAAVALHNSGVPVEDIANRLRWTVPSVKHYLRECFTVIGTLTERAIAGAMMT